MSVSKEVLRKEINAILKDADLSQTSAKKVRQQLEEKLDCDLTDRKKEVDELVMDFINSRSDSENEDEASEDEDSDPKPAKRTSSAKKPAPKKKKRNSSGSESGGSGSGDEYKPSKSKSKSKKRKDDSDEAGSDDEWKAPKPVKSKKSGGGGGKGRGGTGFTRPLQLSPELSSLMGAESLPRHEVVKKVWAIIKERNLYDPKNKQFAICDADLLKVFKVKRFRTFGMMKYLQSHFIP